MKHAVWLMGLLLGAFGCSGATIGGDGGGGTAGNDAQGGRVSGGATAGGPGAGDNGQGGNVDGPGTAGASESFAGSGAGGFGGAVVHATGGYEPDARCNSSIDAWIAFDSDAADFNRDIYLIRPDGSQRRRLTDDPSIEKEPAFSPDGTQLSFTSDRDGSLQVYLMNLSDQTVTQVTSRSEGADESSFSPDGTLLAFHSGLAVYTIKLDGTEETLIASSRLEPSPASYPKFLGSDQLVFDSYNQIDATNLDQTNLRTIISPTTTAIVSPAVSPQNSEIVYASWCPNESTLSVWTTPANSSSQTCSGRRVSPAGDPLTNARPAWGPANTFAYERFDKSVNIGRITLQNRAAGSRPCSLTPADEDSRNPNWSSEGLEL